MAATNNIIASDVTITENGPRVVIDSTGRLLTAYRRTSGGGEIIVVAYSDDNGETWSEVSEATTDGESHVQCAIDGEDVLHVVYLRNQYIVSYRPFSGGAWGTEEDVFDGTANTDTMEATIDVAIDSNNIPHVAWSQDNAGDVDDQVWYSNRSSGSWATKTQLSANDAQQYLVARIAIDSNDYIYVVYVRQGTLGGNDVVFYNKYTNSWLGETQIDAPSSANVSDMGIVIDSLDDVHVVWTESASILSYIKYDESTDTWGAATTISTDTTQDGLDIVATIGVDSSDNLSVVHRVNGNVGIMTSTDGGANWSATSEIVDLSNSLILPFLSTPRYPIIEGVNTQIPTSGYQFLYYEVTAGSFRLHRSDGITLQTPVTDYYSKEDNAALPTTDRVLDTLFTPTGHSNVASDDNVFENQTATDEYAIFVFKNRGEFDTDDIVVTWRGKSDIAPSTSTVTLQVYNYNTAAWETKDSDSATGAGTEFELTFSITASQSNYYDDNNWVTCRVYQLAQ